MRKKILILDSNKIYVRGLAEELRRDNYIVETIYDGKNVIEKIDDKVDMILLDLDLNGVKGQELCREIRLGSEIPIIIITTRISMIDKIVSFEAGADDYLIKPFEVLELKARMKAIFRRVEARVENNNNIDFMAEGISIGEFNINPLGRTLRLNEEEIVLTVKEFDIFYILITNKGRVFKREELLKTLWDDNHFGDIRTIDVHVRRIREKLGEVTDFPYIMTKWGAGYYFNENKI